MRRDLTGSELYEAHYRLQERRSNARFLAFIFLLFLFFFSLRIYWTNTFGGVEIDGASMNKTLFDGEKLLMKYSKDGRDAKRGDIIVVSVSNYKECVTIKDGYLIKRLIAVEGDIVRCVDGQVYIQYAGSEQEEKLDEPYAYYHLSKSNYDFGPYTVGEGEIFFLGDNRQNSIDSRYGIQNGSHLADRLYKVEDIYGIVPEWAVENQKILEKIFFH